MSKSNTFENDLLKLIFNATAIANLADNAASAPLTNLYVSLHTNDPGEAGVQTTNECAYVDYARITVARTSGGWTIAGNSVSPTTTLSGIIAGAGTTPETATYAAIGTALTGAGKILYSGALSPTIAIDDGVTPQITTSSTITEE